MLAGIFVFCPTALYMEGTMESSNHKSDDNRNKMRKCYRCEQSYGNERSYDAKMIEGVQVDRLHQ